MYPDEERQAHSEPAAAQPSAQVIINLREQMEPEEKTRFDRQVEAEHQKLIAIGYKHLQLQAFPIGLPDAVPMRQFRKKKTHGLADARGLTGTEIAALNLKAREALARNKAVVTPNSPFELGDDDEAMLLKTPPRLTGES